MVGVQLVDRSRQLDVVGPDRIERVGLVSVVLVDQTGHDGRSEETVEDHGTVAIEPGPAVTAVRGIVDRMSLEVDDLAELVGYRSDVGHEDDRSERSAAPGLGPNVSLA